MMRLPSVNNLTHFNLSALKPYFDLCKVRVVALMLLTAIVGMFLASPGFVPFSILFFATLGIGLSACAGGALNHIIDRHLDALMTRTSHRPIPSGKISAGNALFFAGILAFMGMFILIVFVNLLTAFLTLLTLIGYAGIYTLYLKRATSQNIVIGGLAGAAPPLLGWTAVTGQIGIPALLLMLIIFVWTPPHFWALAIHRYKEYKNADIPMLPVSYGIPYTKLSVLLYTILLSAISLLPYVIDTSGLIYLFGTIILNIVFLYWACMLMWSSRPLVAMQTFRYSILYLMLLFILLLVDHYFIL